VDGQPTGLDSTILTATVWLADVAALRQVLVNLVDNAVKHSPTGATVEVTIHYPNSPSGRDGFHPVPDFGAAAPAAHPATPDPLSEAPPPRERSVRLSVRDQGPGIPREEQALIFQRFYRRGSELRRETPGIGLGLAIVQYIVQAHGGSVHVESQVGHGSRFVLELPATRTFIS
jgi:signal transduction histidine kinase